LIDSATCPIVDTAAFDVSDVETLDPTEPNVAEVTLTLPPAVVFKIFSGLASPSVTASANLII
jgi:hypothetical protein